MCRHHQEDRDWRRIVHDCRTDLALIAPHGGNIEGGTSELATAIAGQELSLYCFEGLKPRGNEVLHLSSRRFDDPDCLRLLETTPVAVTVHGCTGSGPGVYVGGLHGRLRIALVDALNQSGFHAIHDATGHSGTDPANICNRCAIGRGVQLELTRGLRAELFAGLRQAERYTTTPHFAAFVAAVRSVLLRRDFSGYASA
ncbi:MAG: poly-gamma-glutamate hydrolase family protein [candidate division Zixibacteria bacterium]|nr:poly-gamma-glutamate hydrolase family protein [candidate division Zixibacteria bacterium]